MELKDFCNIWKIDAKQMTNLENLWQNKISSKEGELPFFFSMEYFEKVISLAKPPFEICALQPYAENVIRIANEVPAVALLAMTVYYGELLETPKISIIKPQEALPYLGEDYTGFFYFMISLGALPLMKKKCKELGIPEQYAKDAMAWFGGTMLAYKRAHHGLPGRPGSFDWIRKYVDGVLFRIGRLEYLLHKCPDWIPAIFRNDNGEIAVLCGDGWRLNAKGVIVDPPSPAVYITHIRENQNEWEGNEISPDGTVDIIHTCTLSKHIWSPIASAWDLCPSIHIPAGERLPFNEVKESLIAAQKFFQKYFHRHIPLFCCNSWILNAAWEKLLPNSNIADFRRQGFAVPSPDWGELGGTAFIFGREDLRPEQMNALNHLEKAMQIASLNQDNNGGSIFFLTSDLQYLGDEYYRKKFHLLNKEKS